ncbi:MAG: hypothetical protein RLY93_10340 [Sumerlaeia bacterium]
MEKTFLVDNNGEILGPWSEDAVRDALLRRELSETAAVREAILAEDSPWEPAARRFPALRHYSLRNRRGQVIESLNQFEVADYVRAYCRADGSLKGRLTDRRVMIQSETNPEWRPVEVEFPELAEAVRCESPLVAHNWRVGLIVLALVMCFPFGVAMLWLDNTLPLKYKAGAVATWAAAMAVMTSPIWLTLLMVQ